MSLRRGILAALAIEAAAIALAVLAWAAIARAPQFVLTQSIVDM